MSDQPTPVVISDREHPHYRCRGVLTGTIVRFLFGGAPMAYVKLGDCPHGGDACYVSKGQVTEDPTPP